jgi:hypothetical protein
MNCCEQTGTGAGCTQGPNCPVRTSRAASAGEAYPLPIWFAGDPLPIWFAGDEPEEAALDAKERKLILVAVMCAGLIAGGLLAGLLDYTWPRWFA